MDWKEKNNAYEKLKNINFNKGKENALETLILNTYNLKSFIKIKDDQINVVISSKDGSYKDANNIIRTIQNEFTEKKYITVIGDTNGDGKLSILDAVKIANHSYKNYDFSDVCQNNTNCKDAADYDQNGTINIYDIIKLANKIYK